MEITKEKFDEMVQHFLKMDSGNRTFTEAYNKGEPYYFKRHKSLIVPSEMINDYFGCNKYRMSAEIVAILQNQQLKREENESRRNEAGVSCPL